MTFTAERLRYLLNRYLQRQCTHAEMDELLACAAHADGAAMLGDMMTVMYGLPDLPEADAVDWDFMFEQVVKGDPPVIVMKPSSRRVRWWRYVAAAVVLIGMLITGWLLFFPGKKETIVQQTSSYGGDITAPVINKATLTLADGRRIILDSMQAGKLAATGNTVIEKQQDGQLVYSGGARNDQPRYNTLSVPKGSRPMQVTLSDGTRVWLNVASSITYPEIFTGAERKVTITGEAYFEVSPLPASPGGGGVKGNSPASHDKMPFIVDVDGKQTIEVLGTHFNVNSYADEDAIRTTLLEGRVKVFAIQPGTSNPKPVILQPGEQAATTNNKLQTTNKVDIDEVMAWKNGRFVFNDASLESILKQVERWYDVEIEYRTKVPSGFVATISRDVPVSKVLQLLQLTGQVNFKIEGKKIIVLPR